MKYKLLLKKYKQQGDITWEYNALRNFKDKDNCIKDFRVNNKYFKINLENPIDIECQSAYDGTVNLIFNDDVNPPRIVNSRWTRTENNTYKVINRDQISQSNLYNEEFIDRETRLFRNVDGITKIDLHNVSPFGKLKAGNYIIYMKYMDNDYNETDIIAQTGVISIFNGTSTNPRTVSGGFMDEETDKSIILKIRDLDTSFSYYKLYVYRTSCDSNGVKLDSAYKINIDYEITNTSDLIYINGFEDYIDISVEELNIQYNIVDSVKTQAQVQNMLFFGNVTKPKDRDSDLQDMSLYIKAREIHGDSIGFVDPKNYSRQSYDDAYQVEYYSPINIYYNLGYWPDEIYRFGIVYIYNDDHLSPVYNLRGCKFKNTDIDEVVYNFGNNDDDKYSNYLLRHENKIPFSDEWIKDGGNYENTKGVFKFSKCYNKIISIDEGDNGKKGVYPLGIEFSFPDTFMDDLDNKGIKGFFFVRQQRIPTVLCQGYSVGISKTGYFPMIKIGDEYIVESFTDSNKNLVKSVKQRVVTTEYSQSSGLLCVDAYLNKQLQSMFDTSEFKLEKIFTLNEEGKNVLNNSTYRYFYQNNFSVPKGNEQSIANLIYIDPEIPQKIHKDKGFSTKAGMQEDLRYNSYINIEEPENEDARLVRGIFTSFVGTTQRLSDGCVYNIRAKNYDESFASEYFEIRMNDNSPYYAISERFCSCPKKNHSDYSLKENGFIIKVFRGDCFTNTVTTRMHRNFTSSSVPINDTIIDSETWKNNFKGVRYTTDWNKINKADVDAVPIGTWMTYKCFSNYNLGLRCIDPFQIEEQSLMGNPRSFYPLQDISVKSSNKINESNLMNNGYNSLLGIKRNFTFDVVPYAKDIFDTRIMFSNIQVDGAFKNSYKIFQGLSYEDIDRQYGSITKIIPWGVNLFCVFEHGLAIIPVNEKALLQTTEGANIHMYGTGVLQKQVVLISDSVGSIWKDSIVKTPVAIYGVDTESHKIWRYSDSKKLEILSDFSMQRFLHDNIDLRELDKYTILGVRNVKTHYNAYKRDVMFTYYNNDNIWNICYNEALGKWITRYSWTPYLSENIDHSLFSFDLMRTKVFGLLNSNLGRSHRDKDVIVNYDDNDKSIIKKGSDSKNFDIDINPYTYYNLNKITVKGFYWNNLTSKTDFDIIYNSETKDYDLNSNMEWKGSIKETISNNRIKEDDILSFNLVNINRISNLNETEDFSQESAMYDVYQYLLNKNELHHPITLNVGRTEDKYLYYKIDINYTPYTVANIDDGLNYNEESEIIVFGNETKSYSIVFIKDFSIFDNTEYEDGYKNSLINSIFVHGRSLNADEINYFDNNQYNQCLPTKWYDTQHPFEFEVVVNEPKGSHKIFDNLMIISNNVEPKSLEIEITGDVYGFKKNLDKYGKVNNAIFVDIPIYRDANSSSDKWVKTKVNWNPIENDYSLLVHQDCANIKEFGRRLGNIYYNEDKWYYTFKPIYFRDSDNGALRSTRIRDKYAKIRVKYSGEKLAIIVALQTMFTLSYV